MPAIIGGMEQAKRRANVKWFSNRVKSGKRRSTPQQIVALRLGEFARMFRARWGLTLPDDDSGRDDIEPVLHHILVLKQGPRKAGLWLELWAPWLTLAEQRAITSQALATMRSWTADQLAWRYRITREERTMLGLTTIGAIDHGKGARTKRRRDRDRQRKERKRRLAGALPRREWRSASLERNKPWAMEGISRRTWYRRHTSANDAGTGPATA